MMTIILHGALRRFGKRFRLDVQTPAEAIRALSVLRPGFRQYLRKHSEPGYHVLVGKADIDAADLGAPIGSKVLRIVPAVGGASSPWVRIVIGAVLIYASSGTYGYDWIAGAMASAGYGLVISGATQLIAGAPKMPGPREEANNQPSYAFDGAVNTVGQGHPVPLLYGRMMVGSAVISAGLVAEQI